MSGFRFSGGGGGGGGGAVDSVFGRTGVVVALAGDYTALKVTNTPAGSISATTVQGAINELDGDVVALASTVSGLVTGVSSVFGRSGAVVAVNGDYTASNITNVPAGNLGAVTVQAALNELDTEKGGLALANAWSGLNTFTTALGQSLVVNGDGSDGYGIFTSYQSATNGGGTVLRHARGSLAVPSALLTNDQVGEHHFRGRGSSAFVDAASISVVVIEGTPSDTAMGSSLRFNVSPLGSVTKVEVARLEPGTGLSMFGANPVIDQNRIFRPRSYTIGTLPSITATGVVHCSDLGGGPGLLQSDGTGWNRVKEEGTENIATDAGHTFTWTRLTNSPVVRGNATLTALRTATLSTTGARNGDRARFVRLGGGAFNWRIAGATNFDLTAADQFCTFEFDGTAWNLIDAGRLSVASGGGGVDVEDEGVVVVAGATTLNFVGAGVTASNAGGGQVDITIPGGGGSGVSIGLDIGLNNAMFF